ncbi:MAG: hypothetical protein FWE95_09090, partial [Planctomycetaceae bacterium]|nr:hypothetical protein [Planctomycetaceae bacterium]
MKQTRIPPLLGKTIRCATACLLAVIVCTAYYNSAKAADATVDTFASMDAWLINNVNAGDTLTLATGAGGQAVITFASATSAIVIDGKGRTIQGYDYAFVNPDGFALSIGNLGDQIRLLVNPADTSTLLTDYQALLATPWATYVADYTGLSTIQGDGLGTDRTHGVNLNASGDQSKWFTSSDADTTVASDASGLNLHNIRFTDVSVLFPEYKHVNGLIGNNWRAGGETSLGNITGNAFTSLAVSLYSHAEVGASWNVAPNRSDEMYLAGGGIIGVRSTGDPGGTHGLHAHATMGAVSGNIFDSITILTTDKTGMAIWTPGMVNPTGSAYLEGGGLVGVNAASSPDTGQYPPAGPVGYLGHAKMDELTDNYFTKIHILSNDILLGGGLVGLNNNSKRSDPYIAGAVPDIGVYALLPEASGNIFGNGSGDLSIATFNDRLASFDIRVEVGYSLRGGGILGMNGLSAAEMILEKLEDNAFAGISVLTGSYLRGGGIVGLQTNDLEHKEGDGTITAAMACLENASGNLFLNQRVDAGSGLRNKDIAEQYQLEANRVGIWRKRWGIAHQQWHTSDET